LLNRNLKAECPFFGNTSREMLSGFWYTYYPNVFLGMSVKRGHFYGRESRLKDLRTEHMRKIFGRKIEN